MKDFKTFLTEVTVPEAVQILQLPRDYSKDDVKKAFRVASSLHHPDKGGDVETMKLVNLAYEKLKGTDGTPEYNAANIAKELKDKQLRVAKEIMGKFEPEAFLEYFKKHFGKKFIMDLLVWDGTQSNNGSPSHAGFQAKFHTKDNTIVFEFEALSYLYGKKEKASLSNNPDTGFTIGITAFGYANRKKQKMSGRDWDSKNDHGILSNPEKAFPPTKMKKMAGSLSDGRMKRADFMLALKNEVKAETWNTGTYRVPVKDGYLLVQRHIFMRVPTWQTTKLGAMVSKYKMTQEYIQYASFEESSETIDQFIKFRKMTMKKVASFLEKKSKSR